MRNAARAAVIGALLAMAAPAAAQDVPSDAAMAFAGDFSDAHLAGMLSRVGGQSDAMRTLSLIDGPHLAAIFEAEIDAAVERHGDEWQRNLALVWDPLLTEAELASLAEEGVESPYADRYREQSAAAGEAMHALSQDLFRQILGEVVSRTAQTLGGQAPPAE